MHSARILAGFVLVLSAVRAQAQVPVLVTLPAGSRVSDVITIGLEPVAFGILNSGNAFRWSPSTGVIDLGTLASSGSAEVCASADGNTIVADTSGLSTSSIWAGGMTWNLLPTLGGSSGTTAMQTEGISGDGSTVVGLAYAPGPVAVAFQWTQANGTQSIPTSVLGFSYRAKAVDSTGATVVGWQDTPASVRQGARWFGGTTTLFTYANPTVYRCGEALGVNQAGTVVVGRQIFGLAGNAAGWRWDSSTGLVSLLPNLPGETLSAAPNDVTDDGTIAVGTNGGNVLGSRAVIWINNAPQDYLDYLNSLGVAGLGSYSTMGLATCLTPDGKVVGGWSTNFQGGPVGGWITYIPKPGNTFCVSDGTLTDHTTPCPCGNTGATGRGCGHSFDAGGAQLDANGGISTDSVVLSSKFEPASAFTLFMQHDMPADVIFHDGVLCAGNTLIRLRGRGAVAGEASFPNPLWDSSITLSQRGSVTVGSGAVRYYAAWYRNASTTFCPPATANVTNGWTITW